MTDVIVTVRIRSMMAPVATRLARALSTQADLPLDRVERAAAVCAETIDQVNPTLLTIGFGVEPGTVTMTFTANGHAHLHTQTIAAADPDGESR